MATIGIPLVCNLHSFPPKTTNISISLWLQAQSQGSRSSHLNLNEDLRIQFLEYSSSDEEAYEPKGQPIWFHELSKNRTTKAVWPRASGLPLIHSISEIRCAHGQFSLLCRRRIDIKIHFCFLESFSVAFDSGLWPLVFSFWVIVFLSIRHFYSWVACCLWLPIYRNLGAQRSFFFFFFFFLTVSVSLLQVGVNPINAIL